jgi:ribosomal protein S18 acetylase RimI-like enzyme
MVAVRDATEADSAFCYETKKLAHRENVIATYGQWDEKFQVDYHDNQWRPDGVRIASLGDVQVGWFAFVEHSDHIAIDGVYVLPSQQRKGIGSQMVGCIQEVGLRTGKPVALFVMKTNTAVRFYEKLGYVVKGETETHWEMVQRA